MRISYSALETYKNCPLRYKFREIEKISEPKSKEAVFGTLIHATLRFIHEPGLVSPTLEQALDYFGKNWNSEIFQDEFEERSAFAQGVQMIQNYYAQNKPADFIIVDLESRFTLEIGDETSGKHIVSGIIDRIDKTKDGYEIIDYKTTRKMPSQEKVDNDLQLSIYLKAFLHRYPKEIENLENITVSLYYVKHGVKLSSKRTKEEIDDLDNVFLSVIHDIEEEKFDPILSPLCDWCGYQKICPLWKHKFATERKVETEEVKQSIDEFVTLRSEMAAEKLRLARLQETILRYMEQEGVERVFGASGIIGKTLRKTYKYDEEKLKALLEPLDKWEDILKVDGIALRNILAILPSSTREAVESTKVPDKESVSLSVKKNKPGEEEFESGDQ
ncbi:MAG: PD-(D/E)XK nuclease family protein [Candidatus Moraniibacteriota bacterium]